jgi:hypothetical protein
MMNKTNIFTIAKSECGNGFQTLLILIALCVAPAIVRAQTDKLKIPAEVQEFIGKGDHSIALEAADLNGDGTMDFILVTEKITAKTNDEEADSARTLMILTRTADGKLNLVKSNKQVVYCKSCGGSFGDPFDGFAAEKNSFTVHNYGGSRWRWSDVYQFDYSRRDKTWQLVLFQHSSYNSLDPNKVKTKTLTPKKFGKVDIADFDFEKFR